MGDDIIFVVVFFSRRFLSNFKARISKTFYSFSVSAIVEFDYTACELDELSLVKGAVITNITQQPGGWWHGAIASTGKSGMFPDNFVKLLGTHHDAQVILR